ncbi:MAG: Ig domain-containing protein [Planctomycetota bacterium]
MIRTLKISLAALFMVVLVSCDGSAGGDVMMSAAKPDVPVVVSTQLLRATVGTIYLDTLQATTPAGTGPVTWSLAPQSSPLPTGIGLASDGTLSGVPTTGGLYPVMFHAENAVGGAAETALDIIIYEAVGYSYTSDVFETPDNDSYVDATDLGTLNSGADIAVGAPLSVTSEPPTPDVDYLKFTTSSVGEIRIDVYFDKFIGNLLTGLHREHNGVNEQVIAGVPGGGGNDSQIVWPNAPAGTWYLKVEAQYKNATWNANAYTLRIQFGDLTISTDLVEFDVSSAVQPYQLQATNGGVPAVGANWTVQAGTVPTGMTVAQDGRVSGTPTVEGLFSVTVQVNTGTLVAEREISLRVYNSGSGDYWQRVGSHRYFDSSRTNGDGDYHEHYCEAMVVAPHPDYGSEGAIYVLGGRVADTVSNVYVFHTEHQTDADRNYKLEDIGRALSSERQYLGAAYLQHSYGGFIYVVGGELYSNTAPSSGDYTRLVERMQVADAAGQALSSPGAWQAVAELPAADGARLVEGWAEFGLVASDAGQDADDRLYLVGGRLRVESAPGSGAYQHEYNSRVLMYEAPSTFVGGGIWHEKIDVSAYSPRRMPVVGMISGRIYIAGGRGPSGPVDFIEMYEPDLMGVSPALSLAGASSFPTLAEAIWYGAGAVRGGALYVMNGWKLQGYAPLATSRLQRFTPGGAGIGGTVDQLAAPDNASGYHSAVFHDGKLWFITGRDSFAPTPHYSLRYEP